MTRRKLFHTATLLALATCCGAARCGGAGAGSTHAPDYPTAEVYDRDPDFSGEWVGEVGSMPGELQLGLLEPGKYFGSFRSDDGSAEYVLLLEQTMVTSEVGGSAPSNRMTFTWQDGQGGRGLGWLLINREDTALTGSFGYGRATEGLGTWTFIRFES